MSDLSAELERVYDVAGFTHDPLGHVLYVYPWGQEGTELARHAGPRAWQREILERIGEKLSNGAADVGEVIREAVSSGHGIGKSALVAWIIKWALDTREDARCVVTANTDSQLRTKTWPEVSKWHGLAINRHWFTLTATALISVDKAHEKTWRADAIPWSEHNTEAFAGLHNEGKRILLVFDEASAIADKVWEVAEGALTDSQTEIIWAVFGNPTRNSGRFRECFRKYKHRWAHRQIDSRTVEGTNTAQFDQWVADYGEDSDFVKIRVRGLFPNTSISQFIPSDLVDRAYGLVLAPSSYAWAPKILTCDPAWEGDDLLVIGIRQGLRFEILHTQPKNDNDMAVGGTLARLEDEHRADAVFIDGGYGTGIVSYGRTLGRNWQLVWFAEASGTEGYLNKRAEMYGEVKKWLREGGSFAADPELKDELTAMEAVPRVDGKIQLESKQDMKKRGLSSPNKADALALSFAHPVQARGAYGGELVQAMGIV